MLFCKMHGCGNDFVVLDWRQQKELARAASHQLPGSGGEPADTRGTTAVASAMAAVADRHCGVGCDQLIVLLPPATAATEMAPASDPQQTQPAIEAPVRMRIFNADGGEVQACGNATRCVAALLMHESGQPQTCIQGPTGIVYRARWAAARSSRADTDPAPLLHQVEVDMGQPVWSWAQIPLARPPADVCNLQLHYGPSQGGVAVSMGNPHVVFWLEDSRPESLDSLPLHHWGPQIEHDALFPQRVNVSVAQRLGRDRVRLRVWERGAGLTLACGTAACATFAAGRRQQLLDAQVAIELPGGVLHLRESNSSDGSIAMAGSVETSFTGQLGSRLASHIAMAFQPGDCR